MKREPGLTTDDGLMRVKILDAARAHIRRFGESKTNVVDIARTLGTSHTTIYRHFRAKAEVFDAIVVAAMRDEEELARAFIDATTQPASERLTGMVLALHQRKLERFGNDPEIYGLYRRVVEDRPDIIRNYAEAITRLLATIIADGIRQGEFKIDDVDGAAGVVRDAVTVFVSPSFVEAAAKAGRRMEPDVRRVMATLIVAFKHGVVLRAQPDS